MKSQRGNVLFLILIAVALFAALSYAVTQSSRTGGNDANRETNVINTAVLSQYPNQMRTAVLRMVIAGVDSANLQFNKPDQLSGSGYTAVILTRALFHPSGGSASYTQVPGNIMASGNPADWKFTMDFMIPNIGSDVTGGDGNDLIAFVEGVNQSVCSRINQELGHTSNIPNTNATLTITNNRTATTTAPVVPASTGTIPNDGGAPNWFANKAYGCFQNNGGAYVYYYVLNSR